MKTKRAWAAEAEVVNKETKSRMKRQCRVSSLGRGRGKRDDKAAYAIA